MKQQQLYPSLKSLIQPENLPDPVNSMVASAINKLFYKNYYSEKSVYGDIAYHNLVLVFNSKLGFNFFDGDEGLQLLFNPGAVQNTVELPVSLYYNLPILKYTRRVKLQNLGTAKDFFDLIIDILQFPKDELLFEMINAFFDGSDDPVAEFVNQFNDNTDNSTYTKIEVPEWYSPLSESEDNRLLEAIQDISDQLEANGVDVFKYVLDNYISHDNLSEAFENITVLFRNWLGEFTFETFTDLFIPKFSVSLPALELALAFPRTWLKPVDAEGNVIKGEVKSMLKYHVGGLTYSSMGGFEFKNASNFDLDKSQIGDSGLTISLINFKIDLSRKENVAEADLAGYSRDFLGLYVHKASIEFTRFGSKDDDNASAEIYANDMLIGTGGVSGTIGMVANGKLYRKFGTKFAAELHEFSITFRQGAIVSSSIKGNLTIPKFKKGTGAATIDIQAHIFDNGDFTVTASPPKAEPYILTLPNVLELEVRSLSLGKRNDHYYIEIAGKLDFIVNIEPFGDVLPKDIEITKLLIWDDGSIEFEGGSIILPKSFRLQVGPVKLEVSNISMGGYSRQLNGDDRKYLFFGFDGMINTGRAGVSATGNGIKYYFTNDDGPGKPFDQFFRIDGIGIDISIPGNVSKDKAAFLLDGYLSMKNPDTAIDKSNAATEYTGSVNFSLPKIKLAGSAGMRLQPSVPSFVVDIGLDLATPIPIAATGLGIYGFRGLIGQHYVPDKTSTNPKLSETATWWEYYKAKSEITKKEGIEIDKFGSKPGFSFGAGASIATLGDSGKAFSSKLFLLLGLPDVFLIQGQAAILRERIGLHDDTDPPFSALIVFSNQSVRGNLNVNYNIPEEDNKGDILSLQGTLDMAFFFNNASGWYLNVGKDNPESERVQAKILSLFYGHAYLMLSMQGIKAGAGVKYDFNKSYGPIGISAGAFLNIGGSISFKPVQIGGYIQMGGYAYVKLYKFSMGLTLAASLVVEAPNPFNIVGSVQINAKTPWPLPDINVKVELSWRFNRGNSPLLEPIPVLELPAPEKGYLPAIATNILSNETFPLNWVTTDGSNIPAPDDQNAWKYSFANPDLSAIAKFPANPEIVIPLDSFIDIDLLQPVNPGSVPLGGAGNQVAEGYNILLPPQKGIEQQVKHELELAALNIYAWDGSSWKEYNIYEAVSIIVSENENNKRNNSPEAVDLKTLKQGYWQFMEPNRFNKIRILSQHMFSFASRTISGYADLDARNFGNVFCANDVAETVINWKAEQPGIIYAVNSQVAFKGTAFLFKEVSGSIQHDPAFNAGSLFTRGNKGALEIIFPEPISRTTLHFGINTNKLEVLFCNTSYKVDQWGQAVADDAVIVSFPIAQGQQSAVVSYDSRNYGAKAIDKVVLRFDTAPSSPQHTQDYDGDFVIGGHFELPAGKTVSVMPHPNTVTELSKALQFVTLYNRSFAQEEVLNKHYRFEGGMVAQWPLDTNADTTGIYPGQESANLSKVPGFYEADASGVLQLHEVFSFTTNADALVVPYVPALKIENASFAFEVTAGFNPFSAGTSTLLYKIKEDRAGYKKGFALHLVQNTPGNNGETYVNEADIPGFTVQLTCYNGINNHIIVATEKYTLNCASAQLAARQYKHIFVSVNRVTNKIDIYIDRVLKVSTDVPAELDVSGTDHYFTSLNELRYLTQKQEIRLQDTQVTPQTIVDEVQVLGDGINKVMQPVWRPDTIYAIKVSTSDTVEGSTKASTHIFGFRTVGPVGHFHLQNKKFQELARLDRADEFKLATLKHYIDYERSYPDAQSRYDLSKPVFTSEPEIRLFFTKPYINAMFSAWDAYQGLPAAKYALTLELLHPDGTVLTSALEWETLPTVPLDVDSLPEDLKIIYYLNQAEGHSCSSIPPSFGKRIKQGVYTFSGSLKPFTLYTALFSSAKMENDHITQQSEVHKYSFTTSRYANFTEQVKSYVLNKTAGAEAYDIYTREVAFTAAEINISIKTLIDENQENDPGTTLQYAVKFDRLIYGGLQIKDLEPVSNTTITLVINTDESEGNSRKILGILIRNPEPFNDPKLPAEQLKDTILIADDPAVSVEPFIYIHSRDTSAVFITNKSMNIPVGTITVHCSYIRFDGTNYVVAASSAIIIPLSV